MHLTGGQLKGRRLISPKEGVVKPTLSKVRESVFNILNSEFQGLGGLSFLDMFTGSGIMALEAFSRGFFPVWAIENDFRVYKTAQTAFKSLNAEISLLKGDSLKIIEKLPEFDVIYIDPPWDFDYNPILEIALDKVKEGGLVVVESDKKKAITPYQIKGKEVLPFKEKIYGRCIVSIFKKPPCN